MTKIKSPVFEAPLGTIVAYALRGVCIPQDWLPCDGSKIPDEYVDLIQEIGMFTPDLRGRTLVGAGAPPYPTDLQTDGKRANFDQTVTFGLLAQGGEYQHQLSVPELPRHSHTINAGNFGIHMRSFEGQSGAPDRPFETEASIRLGGTDPTGSDSMHYNLPPYCAINYIIRAGKPAVQRRARIARA
jgi:microcystin-dependent protein